MLRYVQFDRKTLVELLRLALPMIVSQGTFALMIFTDRFFMSMISPMHMAASLGGGITSYFCVSLFIGLLSYANALVAQYYGAKEWEKCSLVVTQSLFLCLFFIPPLVILTLLAGRLFTLMGHPVEQIILEQDYFHILMWGSLFTLLKVVMASYFSGIGQTKVVMKAEILGVILNIPLTYLLIFGGLGVPALGIIGAALGTVISTLFALLVFVSIYLAPEHREKFQVAKSFVYHGGILRRYLRLGFPSGLETFLNVAAFNLFLLLFQSYGVAEGASAAIIFNWDIVSYVPMFGLNIALVSLIGRFVGAQDTSKMDQVISAGFLVGLGYSGILAVLFIVFKDPLVELFITPGVDYHNIRELSRYMMIGLASYVMADALICIGGGVLRGAGDTKWLLYASVILHWLMFIAQFIAIKVLMFGPRISWVIFVLTIMIIAFIYMLRLNGDKWRHPETLERVMAEY